MSIPSQLRNAYGNILDDIYINTMLWMYDKESPSWPEEDLKEVLDCIKTNGAEVDPRSFEMELALWQDINDNMDFPLPRLRHIIPLVFAHWNSLKGGSDATTNLIWHCQYSVPNDENQSVAVARMLSVSAVHVHRLLQIATAREDTKKYGSLKRFRDAATSRVSFKKTQFMIINHITALFTANEAISTPPPAAPRRDPGRAMRSQTGIERIDIPFFRTNKTPKRNVAAKLVQMEEKLLSGRLDLSSKLVVERSKQCAGMAVWCIGSDGTPNGKGSRGSCAYCGHPTHNFCLLCKRWLCDSPSDTALKKPDWKSHIIINPGGDTPSIHCRASCFLLEHRKAQESNVKRFNLEAIRALGGT